MTDPKRPPDPERLKRAFEALAHATEQARTAPSITEQANPKDPHESRSKRKASGSARGGLRASEPELIELERLVDDGRPAAPAPREAENLEGRHAPGENHAVPGPRSKRSGSRRSGQNGAERPATDAVTPTAIEEAALRYLNRYDASVDQLRRVLVRRAQRHVRGPDLEQAKRDIEALLTRFQAARLLDDARYAEALARGLRARGSSSAAIRAKMRSRGVAAEHTDRALALLDERAEEGENPELHSARIYARKRRLATRFNLNDPLERRKALAALARKGFSFSIAQQALLPDPNEE